MMGKGRAYPSPLPASAVTGLWVIMVGGAHFISLGAGGTPSDYIFFTHQEKSNVTNETYNKQN